MNIDNPTLIIGGDSVVGRYLRDENPNFFYTSRKENSEAIYFDLLQLDSFNIVEAAVIEHNINTVIILASITSIKQCELQPEHTLLVNVQRTKLLLEKINKLGCFIIFISTNHIFDCKSAYSVWNSIKSPCSNYGYQKLQVEDYIVKKKFNVGIIRPSKIIHRPLPLIEAMIESLTENREFEAFDDHYFAPISIQFFSTFLKFIIQNKKKGIFQISGKSDLSYYVFLKMLASKLNLNSSLITPVSALSKGVIPNKYGTLEAYNGLCSNLLYQSVEDTINDYCQEN
jgi:dTDP-4-dehydrorhamnose reductase